MKDKIKELLEKYNDRLETLKFNKKHKLPDDDYPYELDIETTEEIINDLESLNKSKDNYRRCAEHIELLMMYRGDMPEQGLLEDILRQHLG